MKVESIVFGPADLTRLLTASVVTQIFRMQAEITMEDNGTITAVTAYPIDETMQEITALGKDFRIKGCPEPPGCGDIH